MAIVIFASACPIHFMAVLTSTPAAYRSEQYECLKSCVLMVQGIQSASLPASTRSKAFRRAISQRPRLAPLTCSSKQATHDSQARQKDEYVIIVPLALVASSPWRP